MRSAVLLVAFLSSSILAGELAWAAPTELVRPPGLRNRIHAVAADAQHIYLATGDNRAELVVLDLVTGAVLGSFDAPGKADALSVKVPAPGRVKLGRRRGDEPEVYHLDVTDPQRIVVLATGERARHVRWKPEPLPPVRFADVNGDGVYRLACLGDSNTSNAGGLRRRWCEVLEDEIADARFEVINVAVSGATVTDNRHGRSDARTQLAQVIDAGIDAIVLSFGTNDRFDGAPPRQIRDAYQEHVDAAERAGLTAYVATTPPTGVCLDVGCPLIADANVLLHEAFGGRTLDFFTGIERSHMDDAIHLDAEGQALRAQRAAALLAFPRFR